MNWALFNQTLATDTGLVRGLIHACRSDGLVEVRVGGPEAPTLLCQVLVQESQPPLRLVAGQEVLVAQLPGPGSDGIVLGKVGSYQAPSPEPEAQVGPETTDTAASVPGEAHVIQAQQIILQADQELTLRCGSGSIRIQEDGKVIIRGEHVLNSARGTNRIKGGSVGIN